MRPLSHLPEYDRRIPVNDGAHSFIFFLLISKHIKKSIVSKKLKIFIFFYIVVLLNLFVPLYPALSLLIILIPPYFVLQAKKMNKDFDYLNILA